MCCPDYGWDGGCIHVLVRFLVQDFVVGFVRLICEPDCLLYVHRVNEILNI